MDRRHFVAALVVGSTGCLSESQSGGGRTSNRGSTTERPAGTPSPTEPATSALRTERTTTEPAATDTTVEPSEIEPTDTEAPDTETPGTATPTLPQLQAAPGDCPGYGDDVVSVVCYDAAPDDAPMVMEPSRSGLDLPGEIEFMLENGTGTSLQTNFYSARLHKRVDDEWYLVAPQGWPQPLTPLAAGESHTWAVSMSGAVGDVSPPNVDSGGELDDTSRRTVAGLGGGRYAFGIDGNFREGSYKRQTAFAATIDVRGDPIELTTTENVASVAVEGDVLTARWTGGNADSKYAREATYVLERVDEAPDRRLITEQVVRPRRTNAPLQDALALATERSVDEVRLTGQTASSPPFGVQGRVIGYEGSTYEISASETGTETES